VKKVITHINPDLDAVTSVWLIKRFLPGWQEAEVDFVFAGEVKDVDSDPDILYVDTGRGKLDHHQISQPLSAAKLCRQYIQQNRQAEKLSPLDQEALDSLVAVVTEIDTARDLKWPETKKSRSFFYLHWLISNLRDLGKDDQAILGFGFQALDAILLALKSQIKAKQELKEGQKFTTAWGRAIAMETGCEDAIWEGEVQGYCLVVRKDPESGGVRIYARWDNDIDLTKAYNKLKQLDSGADWFLHASKKLLLNQSKVNPNLRPTKLSFKKVIEVLKKNLK